MGIARSVAQAVGARPGEDGPQVGAGAKPQVGARLGAVALDRPLRTSWGMTAPPYVFKALTVLAPLVATLAEQ